MTVLEELQARAKYLEDMYYQNNRPGSYEVRNEFLRQLNEVSAEIEKITNPTAKVIPNNEIIGPPLVPVQGQVNKIPILPIAVGVGILILVVALVKKRKR